MRLVRDYQGPDCTLGQLERPDGTVLCQTLELPWRGNQPRVSCIPAGTYIASLHFSPAHGQDVYWVNGVPGRSAIEIHVGNTAVDSLGCILVGRTRSHLGDQHCISHSRLAFSSLMQELAGVASFALEVLDPPSALATGSELVGQST